MTETGRLAVVALLASVTGWWLVRRPFRFEVAGWSMAPTLLPGDWVIAVRPWRVHRGALVVVQHPDRPGFEMVKRVAALPGTHVAERTLGPGEFWVLGDDPGSSTDSRTFGPISRSSIKGVVVVRYWPAARSGRVAPPGGRR